MDITAALQAKQAGRRRKVDVTRAALRLTDKALAELRGHLAQTAARSAEPDAEGPGRGWSWSWPTCKTPGPATSPASPA